MNKEEKDDLYNEMVGLLEDIDSGDLYALDVTRERVKDIMRRIKPQPKEIWVNEYFSGGVDAYLTQASAEEIGLRGDGRLRPAYKRVAVQYREIIDE